MSIINQALKKAQREQQSAPGGTAWVLPAAPQAKAPGRRGQTLWIVMAALFALSLGATLHAWLGSPTAGVETVTSPTPQPPAVQPVKAAETDVEPARRIVNPVPRQRPAQPTTASVVPVRAARAVVARRPVLPATATDYTTRGNVLYHQGEYQRAIDMYQAALALDPLDVKARNNLGSAYLQLAMDDHAAAAFQEALRLDDAYGLAYYNLACVQARAGDADSAAAYLQQAVAITPEARDWARTDSDFAAVRDASAFRQLLEPR